MELNQVYAAALILVGIMVALIARKIVAWLKVKAEETDTLLDDIVMKAIGTPVQITIIAFSFYLAVTFFNIYPSQLSWVTDPRYITSFWIIIGAWILSSFLHNLISFYGRALAESSEGDWDDRLVELLELIIKYLVWFLALVMIFSTFEIDITPLLAGAGIAGLAIALAAQDIVSNFFSGALITIDKPFKVGDRVKIDEHYGDIIQVGPRSTRLRTLEYQIVTIPNNMITTNVIINYSMPDPKLKMTIPVSVAYGTDIDKVTKILLEIANDAIEKEDWLLSDPKPAVFFIEFGASDLKFIVQIWSKAYNTPNEVKDCINRRVNARFADEGIEIPFQQVDIHMRT
jgi:MscS family membrane protein